VVHVSAGNSAGPCTEAAQTGVTTGQKFSREGTDLGSVRITAKRENGKVLLSTGGNTTVVMPERNWDRLIAALIPERK
jgi:hypothetical protein